MKKLILISLLISAFAYAQDIVSVAVKDTDEEWKKDSVYSTKFLRYDMAWGSIQYFANQHYTDESLKCAYLKAAKVELDRLVDLPNDCN